MVYTEMMVVLVIVLGAATTVSIEVVVEVDLILQVEGVEGPCKTWITRVEVASPIMIRDVLGETGPRSQEDVLSRLSAHDAEMVDLLVALDMVELGEDMVCEDVVREDVVCEGVVCEGVVCEDVVDEIDQFD